MLRLFFFVFLFSFAYGDEVTVTYGGGGFDYEISFELKNAAGDSVCSGADGGDVVCDLNCGTEYHIKLLDEYGDGWNGAVLDIDAEPFGYETGTKYSQVTDDCGDVPCNTLFPMTLSHSNDNCGPGSNDCYETTFTISSTLRQPPTYVKPPLAEEPMIVTSLTDPFPMKIWTVKYVPTNTADRSGEIYWELKDAAGNLAKKEDNSDCTGGLYEYNSNAGSTFATECIVTPGDTYTFEMKDAYGDTWDHNYIGIDKYQFLSGVGSDGPSNLMPIFPGGATTAQKNIVTAYPSGIQSVSITIPTEKKQMITTGPIKFYYGGGQWSNEISWELKDADANFVKTDDGSDCKGSGDGTIVCLVEKGLTYVLSLEDSYGDGWNGNTIGIGAFEFTGQGSNGPSNLMAIFADGATTETIDTGASKQVIIVIPDGNQFGGEFKLGCMISTANNYDSAATDEDRSCVWDDPNSGSFGPALKVCTDVRFTTEADCPSDQLWSYVLDDDNNPVVECPTTTDGGFQLKPYLPKDQTGRYMDYFKCGDKWGSICLAAPANGNCGGCPATNMELQCNEGFVVNNGECTACPVGYISSDVLLSTPYYVGCDICDTGYSRYGTGWEGDGGCHAPCSDDPNADPSDCNQCKSGYYPILANNKCGNVCPDDFYADPSNACGTCKEEHGYYPILADNKCGNVCPNDSGAKASDCSQCDDGYFRHNPDGSISTNSSVMCTNVCPNDPHATPGDCNKCKEGYYPIGTSSACATSCAGNPNANVNDCSVCKEGFSHIGQDGLCASDCVDDSNANPSNCSICKEGYVHYGSPLSSNSCVDVELVCTPGGYPNEVTWKIIQNNVLMAAGGVGSKTACIQNGEMVIKGLDSWGDGWNDATLTIAFTNGTELLSSWGFTSGYSSSTTIQVTTDAMYTPCLNECPVDAGKNITTGCTECKEGYIKWTDNTCHNTCEDSALSIESGCTQCTTGVLVSDIDSADLDKYAIPLSWDLYTTDVNGVLATEAECEAYAQSLIDAGQDVVWKGDDVSGDKTLKPTGCIVSPNGGYVYWNPTGEGACGDWKCYKGAYPTCATQCADSALSIESGCTQCTTGVLVSGLSTSKLQSYLNLYATTQYRTKEIEIRGPDETSPVAGDGYILSQSECEWYANSIGRLGDFSLSDPMKGDDHPRGCFMNSDNIYYNPDIYDHLNAYHLCGSADGGFSCVTNKIKTCATECAYSEISFESGCTQCTTGILVSDIDSADLDKYIHFDLKEIISMWTYDTTITEQECEDYANKAAEYSWGGNGGGVSTRPHGCMYGGGQLYWNPDGDTTSCNAGGYKCMKKETFACATQCVDPNADFTSGCTVCKEGYHMQTPLYVDPSGTYDDTITKDECLTLGALMNPDGIALELPSENPATTDFPKGCIAGYGNDTPNGYVFWNPNPNAQVGCRETNNNGETFYYCLRKRERKCVSSCDDPLLSPEGGCYSTCANDKLLTYDPTVLLDVYDVPYETYISASGTTDPNMTREECPTTTSTTNTQPHINMGCFFSPPSFWGWNAGFDDGLGNILSADSCYNVNDQGHEYFCGKRKPLTCIDLICKDDPNADPSNACGTCKEGYFRHNPDGSISTDSSVMCTNVCPNDDNAVPGNCNSCKENMVNRNDINPGDIYKYNANRYYLDQGTPPSESEMLTIEECRYYMTGGYRYTTVELDDRRGNYALGEYIEATGYKSTYSAYPGNTGYGGKWESDWGDVDVVTSSSDLPLGCSKKKHISTIGDKRGFGYYNPGYDDLGNYIGRNTSCNHVLNTNADIVYELEGCIKKQPKQCISQCWGLHRNISNGCNCNDGYIELGGHCGLPCPYMDDLASFDTEHESSSHCTNLLKTTRGVESTIVDFMALEQGPNVGYCEMQMNCPLGYTVNSTTPYEVGTPFYRRRIFCQMNGLRDDVQYENFQFGNAECVPNSCNFQSQAITNGYILCDNDGLHVGETCEIKCNAGYTESGMVSCDGNGITNTAECVSDFIDSSLSLSDQLMEAATASVSGKTWGRRRRRRVILRRFRRLRRLFRMLMQLVSGDYSTRFYNRLTARGVSSVRLVPPQQKSTNKINTANACDEKDVDLNDQSEAYEIPIDPGDVSLVCMGNTPVSKMILTKDDEINEYKAHCWDGNGWDAGIDVAEEGHNTLPDEFSCDGTPFFVNSHSGDASCTVTSTGAHIIGAGNCSTTLAEGHVCQHQCADGSTPTSVATCVDGVFTETVCTTTTCGINQYVSNHVCVDCALGEVHAAGSFGTSEDTTCTPCGQGLYRSATEDVCTACPDGSTVFIGDKAVESGGTSCVACNPATHYDHDGHAYTACQTTNSTCEAGSRFEETDVMKPNLCHLCTAWQHSAAGDTSCTNDAALIECFPSGGNPDNDTPKSGYTFSSGSGNVADDSTCTANACDGSTQTVNHGTVDCNGLVTDGSCTVTCNTGYTLSSGGVSCPAGTITNDAVCTPDVCDGSTQTVNHGTVDCNGLVTDGSCTVTCNAGYTLSGGVSCPVGTITNDAKCTPDVCDSQPTVADGTVNCGSGLVTDASCSFACNTGYTPSGSITCTEGTLDNTAVCTGNPCSLTSSDILGCDSLITGGTCNPSCPAGGSISDDSVISCSGNNVLSSDPSCSYCPAGNYWDGTQCTLWSVPDAETCIGIFVSGSAFADSSCTPCAATEYENNGDNACTPWSFTAETCGVGNKFTSGSSTKDSSCVKDSLYYELDPSDRSLDFSLHSASCGLKVAVIGVTGITGHVDTDEIGCIECNKDMFLELYSTSYLGSSYDEYKRGACCVNSHHHVCQLFMEEYKKKCGGREDCPKAVGV